VSAAKTPRTQEEKAAVELSATRKYGPSRAIVEIVTMNPASARVLLDCKHKATALQGAKTARCRQCRPKENVTT
jgi:hypothetical protein